MLNLSGPPKMSVILKAVTDSFLVTKKKSEPMPRMCYHTSCLKVGITAHRQSLQVFYVILAVNCQCPILPSALHWPGPHVQFSAASLPRPCQDLDFSCGRSCGCDAPLWPAGRARVFIRESILPALSSPAHPSSLSLQLT